MKLTLQVAAGILLASLIGFAIRLILIQAAVEQITKTVQAQNNAMMANIQATQRANAAAKAAREADALKAKEDAAREAIKRNNEVTARLIEDQHTRQVKEAAWTQAFHPRPACDSPPNWNEYSRCINERMRAQKAFETSWAAAH